MMIGMLWYDNDPKTLLSVKIQKAQLHYKKKYGSSPNICLVNPSMSNKKEQVGELTVKPYPHIPTGHMWIGVEKDE